MCWIKGLNSHVLVVMHNLSYVNFKHPQDQKVQGEMKEKKKKPWQGRIQEGRCEIMFLL